MHSEEIEILLLKIKDNNELSIPLYWDTLKRAK